MDEVPEVPQPIPEISRGPLWISLLLPPLATVTVNLILGLAHGRDDGWGILLVTPWVAFFLIIGCMTTFVPAVGMRYHGWSQVVLSSFYFMGQIIVCMALWLGSFLLVIR